MTTYVLVFSCLLITSAHGAPLVTKDINDIIKMSTLLYTADHNITALGIIIDEQDLSNKTVLFIEADTTEQGERIDYGLYVLKHGSKYKLLENARDIVVVNLATAYFAAKDGIYYYDKETNSAQKYGSANDEIISLAAENGTGVLYYLNKQHQLYKITEDGRKSTIIDAVKNAQEIVIDNRGTLYYYLTDKTMYMYDGNNTRKIDGVPDNMRNMRFIKTPLIVEKYVLFNGDDYYYVINSENATVVPISRPQQKIEVSAESMDAGVLIYFAKDKKIYEFNIIEKIVGGLLEAIAAKFDNIIQNLRRALNFV